MQQILVTCPVHVDPALECEPILPARRRPYLIEIRLHVALDLCSKRMNDRLFQEKQIERVMPPADVRPVGGILLIRHQSIRQIFELRVQVREALFALIHVENSA